ncbi:DUF2807 domain-containing protein [Flavobacterium magnum]|uniref:DUF2807 domain-containing protein n=1 Tax=Flavobacterium magnum TaxID=2162713 RepID=A0A2S0RED0_9FLAO|nr:head GIN domain-containing protein [Flavobacterium magnum]AWA30113.1 DUF2807 domain-containing protein [Flavobacterium magnum]
MIKAIIFLTKIVIAAAIGLLFVSCRYNVNFGDGIDGSGNVIRQNRSISGNFTGVSADGGIEVIVEQGAGTEVTVEADDNIMSLIKTEVINGILTVRTDGSYSTANGPVVTVRLPEIKELQADGGATLRGNGKLICERLELHSSGGAQLDVHVEADTMSMDASGGAGIDVSGKALDVEISASGGSPVDAEQLQANNIKADASGGASISVYPILKLDAEASGGGSVGYHKIPKTLSKSESGGGSVSEE